jgi:hypothetical protein
MFLPQALNLRSFTRETCPRTLTPLPKSHETRHSHVDINLTNYFHAQIFFNHCSTTADISASLAISFLCGQPQASIDKSFIFQVNHNAFLKCQKFSGSHLCSQCDRNSSLKSLTFAWCMKNSRFIKNAPS